MWADDLPESDLRHAVAVSTSWRGVLRILQRTSPRAGRRLRERCDAIGISYEHFLVMGTPNHVKDADEVKAALATAGSWREAMERLGYSAESGSARSSIRVLARGLGIDVGRLDGAPDVATSAFSGKAEDEHLRKAAPLLVAAACTLLGHDVSWPLEPRPYDLLVDTELEGLLRVQVKSGTCFKDGSWIVWITRSERGRRCAYSSAEVDYFGIVSGARDVYMVPVVLVEGQTALSLRRYEGYRLQS